MRTTLLCGVCAALLSASGLAALTPGHGVAHYPHTPIRPHSVLGVVQVLARPEPDTPAATPLAHAARMRYGRIDALVRVRTQALPGEQGALISGVAVLWD